VEKICLDFDIALDFLRGDPATIEKLKYYADREDICITSLTLLHLHSAIKKPEVIKNFAESVTVLAFDKKAAQIAAHINKELRDQKEEAKIVETAATAAVCLANDAFLYARTPANYDGIKGLRKV